MTSELGILLSDSIERLITDHQNEPQLVNEGGWRAELWSQLNGIGVNLTLVDEQHGGASGGWQDAFLLLQLVGKHGIALPIAENMITARVLSTSDMEMLPGIYSIATRSIGSWETSSGTTRFSGEFHGVPWGRHADHIVCEVSEGPGGGLRVLPRAAGCLTLGANLAGEPRDRIAFNGVAATSVGLPRAESVSLFDLCALARLPQIVGCLSSALEMSVQYAMQREQFGRPLGQFQAIQQQLAQFGAEVAAVSCAARSACRAADFGAASFQIASAKLRANQAIGLSTAVAHQVHGAIGFTREYALHRLTQRLWSWRSELGNDRYWSEKLGAQVARAGADAFWRDLTARDDALR